MKLETVHHIAVIVSDYERAMDFYVRKLGFRVRNEISRPEQGDTIVNLCLEGLELELFVKPGAPARVTDPEALGLRHLAFRVASVPEAVAWLAERGIPCEPVRMDRYANCRMTFFHDPDGLPLELHE